MSYLSKPMYSLTVEEYIELTRRIIAEETKKQINEKLNQKSVEKAEDDIIFFDDVLKITGYKKSTLYTKISRYEIPVLSRRTPLTFSKKALLYWINDGRPSVIEQDSIHHINSKLC